MILIIIDGKLTVFVSIKGTYLNTSVIRRESVLKRVEDLDLQLRNIVTETHSPTSMGYRNGGLRDCELKCCFRRHRFAS